MQSLRNSNRQTMARGASSAFVDHTSNVISVRGPLEAHPGSPSPQALPLQSLAPSLLKVRAGREEGGPDSPAQKGSRNLPEQSRVYSPLGNPQTERRWERARERRERAQGFSEAGSGTGAWPLGFLCSQLSRDWCDVGGYLNILPPPPERCAPAEGRAGGSGPGPHPSVPTAAAAGQRPRTRARRCGKS